MKLTVDDVTQLFNVSEKTIYRWIRSSGLPAFRVNNQYRFNRTDLLEWAASHRVNVSPSLVESTDGAEGAPLPSLAEALATGGDQLPRRGEATRRACWRRWSSCCACPSASIAR